MINGIGGMYMKYEVVRAYVDRITLEERKIGDTVEVDQDRADELKGYIKKINSKAKKNADD